MKYYFHSSGHYIGLYTHDVGNDQAPLRPDMMFTLEPGLYFEELGIGIRIEDTILITEEGCEVLTAGIPKTVEEIERFMQGQKHEDRKPGDAYRQVWLFCPLDIAFLEILFLCFVLIGRDAAPDEALPTSDTVLPGTDTTPEFAWENYRTLIHALGGLEEKTYLNCKESFQLLCERVPAF